MSPAFVALLVLALAPAEPPEVPPIVIRHVSVVDTGGGPTKSGRTVVVAEGQVAAVVDDADYKPESSKVREIDATGKFLIPGLWDMHVHLATESGLPLFVANGVTGVRVMWGNPAMTGFPVPHTVWRREIAAGKRRGPRMVLASNIIDGPKPIWPGSVAVSDETGARKAVRAAKAGGADFVKVYSLLSPESYRAVADEAKAQGLSFAGHVPTLVSAREASDLGQKSMEHLYGILAACSPVEAEMLAARKAILVESKGDWFAARVQLKPVEARLRETFKDDLAESLFSKFKANGTWQCPTLAVLRALGSMDDPAFTKDDRLKYIDPFVRLYWNPKADPRFRSMTADDYKAQRESFARGLTLVGKMHKAGVPILAGTDEANPYIFPGFSLHDELALFVKAGFTPLEALRTATINPARFLGRESTAGTVAPGKEADLVLLDADPTLDIANTKAIRAVVCRGDWLDRDDLDALLKSVEVRPNPAARPPAGLSPIGGFCPDH